MKHQKTAIVFAPYFPPDGGGLENYARAVSKSLAQEYRWRIVVVTSGEKGGADIREEFDGLVVHRLSYQFRLSNTPFSFGWYRKIKAILCTERADLFNIHMPVPGIGDIACLLSRKTPVIVTYHAGSMHKKKLFQDILIWLYEHGPLRVLLRRADRIICSSDFTRFGLLRSYLYKSVTITPGVDTDFFMPDAQKKSSDPTMLFVAGLNHSQEQKGLRVLLDAMQTVCESVSNARLVVVGDGDMKCEYERYADELGIRDRIDFKGRLTGKALLHEYQAAHVFTLPSLNEALGMVIMEAMACELPVIGTRVGGIPLIINDGVDGFLVEENDPVRLAKTIIHVLANPSEAERIAKTARIKMTNTFGWCASAARYEQALTQALGKKAAHIPRITVVSSYFYPKIGGLENYAYLLAKQLHESGNYRVSVLTSNYESSGYRQETINGMTVHRLPIWFRVSNTPVNPLWFWSVKKILAAEQPDIVHAHSPVPFLPDIAAWRAKARSAVVLTYHSGSMLKGKWPIDIIISFYENIFLPKLFREANAVIAVSQEFARRKFPHLAEKIFFIPTGVDLQRFARTPLPVTGGRITYVGRIEHSSSWKGIEQLLQAMAMVLEEHPDAILELVGGGDAIPHYQERARTLGIDRSVVFSGPQLGQGLVDAYRRAKMIVLPSTSDSEAFSIALIEAMASGRPIIGTNIGGTPQVIEPEKNGLLVPPKDPAALAQAIGRMLSDDALAQRLGDYGAMKARDFSWDIQAKKYSDIFQTLL